MGKKCLLHLLYARGVIPINRFSDIHRKKILNDCPWHSTVHKDANEDQVETGDRFPDWTSSCFFPIQSNQWSLHFCVVSLTIISLMLLVLSLA